MLIELRPEFVAAHWDEIKSEVGKALPPVGLNTGMSMNRLLEHIMAGAVLCWAIVGSDKMVQGFLLTQFMEDYCTGTRSLLIYALAGNFTADVWERDAEQIYKFAQGTHCKLITAYTNNRAVLVEAGRLGFNIDYRFIYKEVS